MHAGAAWVPFDGESIIYLAHTSHSSSPPSSLAGLVRPTQPYLNGPGVVIFLVVVVGFDISYNAAVDSKYSLRRVKRGCGGAGFSLIFQARAGGRLGEATEREPLVCIG